MKGRKTDELSGPMHFILTGPASIATCEYRYLVMRRIKTVLSLESYAHIGRSDIFHDEPCLLCVVIFCFTKYPVESCNIFLQTLDKILSAAPPDDPKAHALAQQNNPSRLQQLIDRNFAKPFLLPDIARTITDLAQIVKDTLSNANEFREANEEIGTNGASFNLAQKINEENEALASERVTLKQRSKLHHIFFS